MSNLNTVEGTNQEKYDAILEDIGLKEHDELLEITYAYENIGEIKINKSLFGNIGGIKDYKNISDDLLMDAFNKTKDFLQRTLEKIEKYKNELSEVSDSQGLLLAGSLDYYERVVEYTLGGLPYELEKAGIIVSDLDETQSEKQGTLDNKLFGGPVHTNSYDVLKSHHYLMEQYIKIKHKGLLEREELERFKGYIDKIAGLEAFDRDEYKEEVSNLPEFSDKFRQLMKYKKVYIPREDYLEYSKLMLDTVGIDKKIEVDSGITSVYDGPNAMRFPINTVEGKKDPYEEKFLPRVVKLNGHEIELHYENEKNHDKIIGFRGRDNLLKEEGIAKWFDNVIEGKQEHEMSMSISVPSILMGEILPGDEFLDFMKLRYKGMKLKGDPEGIFYRYKRGRSASLPGVSSKSLMYTYGMRKTVQRVKDGGDVRDLMTGKFEFDDLPLALNVVENKGIELKMPQLISEVVLYALAFGKINEKEFHAYIKEKYPMIPAELVDATPRLTIQQKKNVRAMVEILRAHVGDKVNVMESEWKE